MIDILVFSIYILIMDHLYWPLSVLSRAVDYKNLTGASQHVGLSQPQLSRIIKQLEEDLGVSLLDRKSPRHSSWTPEARKLAQIYKNSNRALVSTLQEFQEESEQKQINIGCLEGLSILAKEFVNKALKNSPLQTVHLNIYDLNQLESKFLSSELDLIFTSRSPGSKKYEFNKTIGYQTFKTKVTDETVRVYSPYEYDFNKRKNKSKAIISNSLFLRRNYVEDYGGKAQFPSEIKKGILPKNGVPVIALAQDFLSKKLWSLI